MCFLFQHEHVPMPGPRFHDLKGKANSIHIQRALSTLKPEMSEVNNTEYLSLSSWISGCVGSRNMGTQKHLSDLTTGSEELQNGRCCEMCSGVVGTYR